MLGKNPVATDIVKRFERAKSDRTGWDVMWQEVADLVVPTRNFLFQQTGPVRRNRIFNATAPNAHQSLAAAMEGLMSSPTTPWFYLKLEDESITLTDADMVWLYDTTIRLRQWFASPRSRWATASHEIYLDVSSLGTAVMLQMEIDGEFRFQARQLSNMYIVENDNGDVVELFRAIDTMTVRDLATDFGVENLSEKLRDIIARGEKSASTIKPLVLHLIAQRKSRDPFNLAAHNKEWSSYYVEYGEKHIISEGGFDDNPYLTPRWAKAAEQPYGYSPAMVAMPSIKTANAMSADILMAGELAVSPPIGYVAGSIEGDIRTLPRALVPLKAPLKDHLPRPIITGVQPLIGHELLKNEEEKIERAFFNRVLELPELDRMTAEEIITRRQQGLLAMSPVMSRIRPELLEPAVIGTFNWKKRTGKLLPPPPSLQGRTLKAEFVSPMFQSQRISEAQNLVEAFRTAEPIITTDPTVVHNLDSDLAFREIMMLYNTNPKLMRRKEDVAQKRQAIEEQEQAAALIEGAQGVASATKDFAAATG